MVDLICLMVDTRSTTIDLVATLLVRSASQSSGVVLFIDILVMMLVSSSVKVKLMCLSYAGVRGYRWFMSCMGYVGATMYSVL